MLLKNLLIPAVLLMTFLVQGTAALAEGLSKSYLVGT